MPVPTFPIVDYALLERGVPDGIAWPIDRFNAVPVSNECRAGPDRSAVLLHGSGEGTRCHILRLNDTVLTLATSEALLGGGDHVGLIEPGRNGTVTW